MLTDEKMLSYFGHMISVQCVTERAEECVMITNVPVLKKLRIAEKYRLIGLLVSDIEKLPYYIDISFQDSTLALIRDTKEFKDIKVFRQFFGLLTFVFRNHRSTMIYLMLP